MIHKKRKSLLPSILLEPPDYTIEGPNNYGYKDIKKLGEGKPINLDIIRKDIQNMKDRNDKIKIACKGSKPIAVEQSDDSDPDNLGYEREYNYPSQKQKIN